MDTRLTTRTTGLPSSPPLSGGSRSGILSSTSTSVAPRALSRAECATFSANCYCEENVVRVLQLALSRGHESNALFAVFISNPQRLVPMRFQRAGGGPYATAAWDYHVVAEVCCEVYDVDSLLPFPSGRSEYFRRSCRPSDGVADQVYQFRRVRFDDVDALFASDRRHMRDGAGRLRMKPPVKPPIRGREAESEHTLNRFLVMGEQAEGDPFRVEGDAAVEAPGEFFPSLEAFLKAMEGNGG